MRATPEANAVLIAAAAVLGLGALAVAGGALLLDTFAPTNYDLLLRNDTSADITDVRLLRDDDELASFPRIPAGGSGLAEDAGTGRFDLEYSDSRGRWSARRFLSRDDDDCYGRQPTEVVVTEGRVGSAATQQLR